MDASELEARIAASYPRLVRRLTLVVGDRGYAEDLAQEACLRALNALPRFDGANFEGWLLTIGTRLALNEVRRRKRQVAALLGREQSWSPAVETDLWDALQRLKPNVRAAFLLNVMEGYTQAEIGAMLDRRPGTVASWIAAAKSQLRRDLER